MMGDAMHLRIHLLSSNTTPYRATGFLLANYTKVILQRVARYLLFITLISQAACATGTDLTLHTFEFNAMWDSPDVTLLDYRYGDTKQPGARPSNHMREIGKIAQQTQIYGAMVRGDDLYVKWRIKSTGEVFEDTVDLKSRLPRNIANNRLRFIANGHNLNVYLVTTEKIFPNPCPPLESRFPKGDLATPDNRIFAKYCSQKIMKLYPGKPRLLKVVAY